MLFIYFIPLMVHLKENMVPHDRVLVDTPVPEEKSRLSDDSGEFLSIFGLVGLVNAIIISFN
jgi:hypothetical protein